MVLPCPVCREPVNSTNGRTFPAINTAVRHNYCISLGVPEEYFDSVLTRRYICFKHFDEHMFVQRGDRKALKYDALPRKLSETEKAVITNNRFSTASYQRTTPLPQHRFKMLSPAVASTSNSLHPLQPSTLTVLNTVANSSATPTSSSTVYPCSPHCEFDPHDLPNDYHEEEFENCTVNEEPKEIKSHPKYVLVQHDKLMELCRRCYRCGHIPEKANPSSTFRGTACKIKLYCDKCKEYVEWDSQDYINGRTIYKGDVEIASAIASAPISLAAFLQFAQILSLAMIDHSTYYKYMPTFWTVVEDKYNNIQQKVFNFLNQKEGPIHLAADGQYDTRGFSALMCCVTVMDAVSRLIVTTVCLDKNIEKCPSTNLERLGLQKGIQELIDKGLNITTLTTDRSKSVIAMMQSSFPNIIHMYDPWHLIKGIAAILRKECKNARAKSFKDWCQGLLNQLWYGVTSANGNGILCQQYAVSALLHSIGIHEWEAGKMSKVLHDSQAIALGVDPEEPFQNDALDLPGKYIHENSFEAHLQCGHGLPYTESATKAILCPLTKSYSILQKTFTNDNFLNDLLHLSPQLATSSLEGFHGLVSNIYRTKNHFFNLKGFTNRTKLAILHYNNNVFDEINGNRKVVREVKLKAKHRGGDIVTKKRKTPPDFTWKKEIIAQVLIAFENKVDVMLAARIFEEGGATLMEEEREEEEDYIINIGEKIDDVLFDSDVEDVDDEY